LQKPLIFCAFIDPYCSCLSVKPVSYNSLIISNTQANSRSASVSCKKQIAFFGASCPDNLTFYCFNREGKLIFLINKLLKDKTTFENRPLYLKNPILKLLRRRIGNGIIAKQPSLNAHSSNGRTILSVYSTQFV
jgi:hypothetical protein